MKRLLGPVAATAAVCAIAAVPAFGATKSVGVKDDFFSPKSMSVKKGTTVKWVWQGEAPHNVTVITGPTSFRSGNKTSGTYAQKLSKKGTYKLTCTVHPGMNQTITVR